MLLGDLEVGEAGDDRCYALRARRTSCRILPTDCGAAEGPLLRVCEDKDHRDGLPRVTENLGSGRRSHQGGTG